MISLTSCAVEYIQKAMSKKANCNGIKFGVKKAGCSGYSYQVDFIFDQTEGLISFDNGPVTVWVDPKDLEFIKGTRIDFARSGLNCRLVFENPNTQDECGCGMSFSV